MTPTRSVRVGVLLLAVLAGCRGGDGDRERPAAQVDTTNTDVLDGMSSQEVEAKAEALTPEQAAARGIAVDTSIHVENLSSEDTAAPGTAPASAGDSGAVPPGKADTAPPVP